MSKLSIMYDDNNRYTVLVVVSTILSYHVTLRPVSCHDVIQSKFYEEGFISNVEERVQRGCSTKTSRIRNMLECALLCKTEDSCIGISMENNGSCFHHRECPIISDSSTGLPKHRYFAKHCAHGTWDPTSLSCQCVDGFYGERCQDCHPSCRFLSHATYEPDVYKVYIHPETDGKRRPFWVVCEKPQNTARYMYIILAKFSALAATKNATKTKTTAVEKEEKSLGFNRTWNEYVNGFRIDGDNFWVGLHAWHRLTTNWFSRYCFEIIATKAREPHQEENYDYDEDIEETMVYCYEGLQLTDEVAKYKFTFESMEMHEGFMSQFQNVSFSTWDSDNDLVATENCAAQSGSGWWHSGATCANASAGRPGFFIPYWREMTDLDPEWEVRSCRLVTVLYT